MKSVHDLAFELALVGFVLCLVGGLAFRVVTGAARDSIARGLRL